MGAALRSSLYNVPNLGLALPRPRPDPHRWCVPPPAKALIPTAMSGVRSLGPSLPPTPAGSVGSFRRRDAGTDIEVGRPTACR